MRFKAGVRLSVERYGRLYTVSPYIQESLHIAEEVWKSYGASELVVTSLIELYDARGRPVLHKRQSEHWQGNAADGRIWNLPGVSLGADGKYIDLHGIVPEVRDDLQSRLGPDFWVDDEPNHMHWHNRPERMSWL